MDEALTQSVADTAAILIGGADDAVVLAVFHLLDTFPATSLIEALLAQLLDESSQLSMPSQWAQTTARLPTPEVARLTIDYANLGNGVALWRLGGGTYEGLVVLLLSCVAAFKGETLD